MRSFLAFLFRQLFRIGIFKRRYYGFQKRIFKPLNLFRGVHKKIRYRGTINMMLEVDDVNQQRLYLARDLEEKEIRYLESELHPGDIFIDLGGNIGQFTLVAARLVGDKGHVYSFEPWPENFRALIKNIQLNQFGNVTAEKMAVADQDGSVSLHLDHAEKNKGMVTHYAMNYHSTEFVPTISLDKYFSNKDLSSLKMMKIDIEGGEFLALKGMKAILEKYKPLLLMEINPQILQHTQFTQAEIEAFLSGLGYKKFFLDEKGHVIETIMEGDTSYNYLYRQ